MRSYFCGGEAVIELEQSAQLSETAVPIIWIWTAKAHEFPPVALAAQSLQAEIWHRTVPIGSVSP